MFLHSFSTKNIFYDKVDLNVFFLFLCSDVVNSKIDRIVEKTYLHQALSVS